MFHNRFPFRCSLPSSPSDPERAGTAFRWTEACNCAVQLSKFVELTSGWTMKRTRASVWGAAYLEFGKWPWGS
jgi:hypothetical protein